MDKWPGFDSIEECEKVVKGFISEWPPRRLVADKRGKFVGMIGMDEPIPGFAESLGYVVASNQNTGIGVEVVPAMAAYAFEVLGFKKVYSCNLTHNDTMKRILTRAGYLYAGQVERGIKDGKPCIQDVFIVIAQTLVLPSPCVIDYSVLVDRAPTSFQKESIDFIDTDGMKM